MNKDCRYALSWIVIFSLLFSLSACNAKDVSFTTQLMPVGDGAVWDLVVIGDPSLKGLGRVYEEQIEKDMGVQVDLSDFVIPNLSAGEVRVVLETGKTDNFRLEALPKALYGAEVVVMFVNPLDSIDPANPLDLESCFFNSLPADCSPESYKQYEADLTAIWAKIFELRAGQPTILRAMDTYNPFVTAWNKFDLFIPCNTCWENMSLAVRHAADAYDIPFVSRFDLMNGEHHDQNPKAKGYLGEDGDTPSELACIQTTAQLAKLGYDPVSLPH